MVEACPGKGCPCFVLLGGNEVTEPACLVTQGGALSVSRVPLPEKLPAAAALALSRDGSRLLLATPDALLLVVDTEKAEVRAFNIVTCSLLSN